MTTTDPTPGTDASGVDHVLDELDPTTAAERRALDATGVLARAATALRHSLDEMREADDAAWEAYSRSLDDATRHLQAELIVASAQLQAERATRAEAVHDAVTSATELLEQRIDTLRVRAHLGRMDAGSAASRGLADLEHRAAEVRAATQRARSAASTSVDDARHTALVLLDDIVELMRLAATVLRDDLPDGSQEAPVTRRGDRR